MLCVCVCVCVRACMRVSVCVCVSMYARAFFALVLLFFRCRFFALRLEMHFKCDNQYKTGADGGNILGQPMLFECMGICILSPAHESKMRGYLIVHLLIVKYIYHLILFCKILIDFV